MDEIVLLPGKLLFVGDFNVHWNKPEKPDVKEYANTLSSANLQQHIDTATHVSGNILAHVICSCDENFVQDCRVYENLITVPRTVHHFVHFKVNLQKPLPQRVTKTIRNFKNIESTAFSQTLTDHLKGGRMVCSDKVSLWCVSLLINKRFCFFLFLNKQLLSAFNVTLRQKASK